MSVIALETTIGAAVNVCASEQRQSAMRLATVVALSPATRQRTRKRGEMFKITCVPEHGLLVAELAGFWSQETFSRFMECERQAVETLCAGPGEHLLLCDVSELQVFPKALIKEVQHSLNRLGRHDARKIAIVCRASLMKLQVRRLIQRGNVAVFDARSLAEDWLLDVPSERPEPSLGPTGGPRSIGLSRRDGSLRQDDARAIG